MLKIKHFTREKFKNLLEEMSLSSISLKIIVHVKYANFMQFSRNDYDNYSKEV